VLVQAKRLPDEPLDEVAADSIANYPRRHRQAEPRDRPGVVPGKYRKEGISRPAGLLVDKVKFALLLEALRRSQAAGSGLRLEGGNERGKRVRR
jgi:hypothetical protein